MGRLRECLELGPGSVQLWHPFTPLSVTNILVPEQRILRRSEVLEQRFRKIPEQVPEEAGSGASFVAILHLC